MTDFLRRVLISLVASLAVCAGALAQGYGELVEREDDSSVFSVDDENERMNAAIDRAIDTIDVFFTALESGKYPRESFMLKILTETAPEQYEHMWYVFVDFTDDENIEGILQHSPYAPGSTYEAEEVYTLPAAFVTDWRFQDGEKLRGDFTTRVLLFFMAEDEPEQAAEILADYHDDPLPPN